MLRPLSQLGLEAGSRLARCATGAGLPDLDGNALHLWFAELDGNGWNAAEMTECLSADERVRSAQWRLDRDRRRFVFRRAILRHILGSYLALPAPRIRFRYGSHGKPSIDGTGERPFLQFNASHSDGLAVVAVARERSVGVDVERIRPELVDDRLAADVLSIAEFADFRHATERERVRLFFRSWTGKEACLKAIGIGLDGRLLREIGPGAPFGWTIWPIRTAPGYAGAAALAGRKRPAILAWQVLPASHGQRACHFGPALTASPLPAPTQRCHLP